MSDHFREFGISFPIEKPLKEEEYKKLYEYSIKEPELFFANVSTTFLEWSKPFTLCHEGKMDEGVTKWFSDGELSLCYNCVDRHAQKRPDAIALISEYDDGSTRYVSYGELLRETMRVAAYMRNLGVKKGEYVVLYMPTIVEAAFAMLACTRIGAVHCVVFGGFSAENLKNRIVDANAVLVVTADKGTRGGKTIQYLETVRVALAEVGTVREVLVLRRAKIEIQLESKEKDWFTLPYQPCDCVSLDAEAPLFVLHTSGSTGKPRGIVHTVGGYATYAALTANVSFCLGETDVMGCLADIAWITGHTYGLYAPLILGASTVLLEGTPTYPDSSRYWSIIEKHSVTILYTSPTAIRMLECLGAKGGELSSLRLLGTVGEPIDECAWRWYKNAFSGGRCRIIDTYWQTETGGHIAAPFVDEDQQPSSAGRPMLGMCIEVVKKDGTIAERGEFGSLMLTSPWPSIVRYVLNDDDGTLLGRYFVPGVGYKTGDVGCINDKGLLVVRGREDDVINISGHRFGSTEIENALCSFSGVVEAAALGIEDKVRGQVLSVFVVIRKAMRDKIEVDEVTTSIRKHLADKIGRVLSPRTIVVVNDLPRTRTGKIMRRLLRALINETELGDTTTLSNPECIDNLKERVSWSRTHETKE